jgi:hypothetical protein
MLRHASLMRVLASTGFLAGSLCSSAMAQSARPDFGPNPSVGWYAYNRQFIAPPSGPGPVVQDPAHPYVPNDEFRATGKQPTQQLADLSNPILQPWTREVIRKRNELVLAGKPTYSRGTSCWPSGVTSFLLSPMTQPMFFVQAPTKVVMILIPFPYQDDLTI